MNKLMGLFNKERSANDIQIHYCEATLATIAITIRTEAIITILMMMHLSGKIAFASQLNILSQAAVMFCIFFKSCYYDLTTFLNRLNKHTLFIKVKAC